MSDEKSQSVTLTERGFADVERILRCVYVRVYVLVRVCVCVRTCVYLCVCLHGRVRVFLMETTRTHTLECACMFSAHFVMCVHACNFCGVVILCLFVSEYVCVSKYTYIYTHIYVLIHTTKYRPQEILHLHTFTVGDCFDKKDQVRSHTHTHTHNFVSTKV